MLLLLHTVACQSQSRCGEELFMVTEGKQSQPDAYHGGQ